MAGLKKALEGIRVLDLGRYQAGPRAGMELARLGAEVIKVEGLTGDESSTRAGASIIDRVTALNGTIGILAALREREFSGEGQAIDVCLADSGFSLTEIAVANYIETGTLTERTGNYRQGSYNGAYKTKDGWVALVGSSQKVFERICQAIGKSEWATDPRFIDRSNRDANVEVAREELIAWFLSKTMAEAVNILSSASVPCTEINTIAQAAASPQLSERELLVHVPDPIAGTIHVSGKYIKLSRSETVVGSPPNIGEHNNEIIGGLLKYSPEELQQLRDEGIIR